MQCLLLKDAGQVTATGLAMADGTAEICKPSGNGCKGYTSVTAVAASVSALLAPGEIALYGIQLES